MRITPGHTREEGEGIMTTALQGEPSEVAKPELHNGDRMTREEFHRIYEQMPEDFQAELIGGIVYVASPLKRRHGTNHLPLGTLFFTYESNTPGVESGDNTFPGLWIHGDALLAKDYRRMMATLELGLAS